MTREVIVLRHAIAFERDRRRWPDDALRPLTPAGKQRFRKAAQGVRDWMPRVDAVLSSPLVRARQTEPAVRSFRLANRKRMLCAGAGHATDQTARILAHDARWVHRRRRTRASPQRVHLSLPDQRDSNFYPVTKRGRCTPGVREALQGRARHADSRSAATLAPRAPLSSRGRGHSSASTHFWPYAAISHEDDGSPSLANVRTDLGNRYSANGPARQRSGNLRRSPSFQFLAVSPLRSIAF